MADIEMCSGKGCPLKKDCYRFTSTLNKGVKKFFLTPPYNGTDCDHLWSNRSLSDA